MVRLDKGNILNTESDKERSDYCGWTYKPDLIPLLDDKHILIQGIEKETARKIWVIIKTFNKP